MKAKRVEAKRIKAERVKTKRVEAKRNEAEWNKSKETNSVHDEMAHERNKKDKCPPEFAEADMPETTQEKADNKTTKADARMAKAKTSEVGVVKKVITVTQQDKTGMPKTKI